MTSQRKHSTSEWIFFICFLVAIAQAISFVYVIQDKDEKIEQYKLKLDQKDSQIYERQLKYEEEKSIADRLGGELADTQERLAQAAERERAAKVRASRSRSLGSSRASDERESNSISTVESSLRDITMYCPTGSRTASGKWPSRGMVATISRSIPFGTHVLIEGLGEYVVEDRIGHGSEFDIFTPVCSEANKFGRQHRRVTVVR